MLKSNHPQSFAVGSIFNQMMFQIDIAPALEYESVNVRDLLFGQKRGVL
jgi:hypothetical protein